MKSTGYKNPEGLTEAGHTTTARDLSILATRLMAENLFYKVETRR